MAEGDGEEVTPEERIAFLGDLIRKAHIAILERSPGESGEYRPVESVIARIFNDYGAYVSEYDQAAVLFHGIITGHIFVDGNKRTGTFAVLMWLLMTDQPANWHPTKEVIAILGTLALATARGALEIEDLAPALVFLFAPLRGLEWEIELRRLSQRSTS